MPGSFQTHSAAFRLSVACFSTACCALLPAKTRADIKLSALFSDHMVLQRDVPIVVWGSADPGEDVAVAIAGQSQSAAADASGKWSVTLEKLPISKGTTLTVKGKNTLIVNDVLVGDVWLFSGQSNVGIPLSRAIDGAKETAAANFPNIRMLTLPSKGAVEPSDDLMSKGWEVCAPHEAAYFSAVGYYFARTVHCDLQIPIGIINSSVGGSPIRGWIARDAQDTVPELRESTEARLRLMRDQAADAKLFPERRSEWEMHYGVQRPQNQGFSEGWARPEFDDHDWKTVAMPSRWSEAAGVSAGGVFWLRKDVALAAAAAGHPFTLVLNYMHQQYDTTYFNGEEIGHTGDEPPFFDLGERRYEVPGRLVKEGRNTIAVRVVSANPRLDLMGRGAYGDYNLPADRKVVGNQWKLHVETLFPALSQEALKARPRPNDASLVNTPTILYNAMIHPLLGYRLRGMLWYQGESDTTRPAEYGRLFPLLIEDWRRRFGQGELPFHFVQLPNYSEAAKDPNEPAGWAAIREAQAATLAKVSNTGMAVTIDIGEGDNMHPINKRDAGERLAMEVLANVYRRDIEASGPIYKNMTVEGNAIRVRFTHGDKLNPRGGPLKRFAIAGADRKFMWADARIDGDTVVVSSPQIAVPVAVRYAWVNNPEGCNLYNGAGLPAAPFRTDRWP